MRVDAVIFDLTKKVREIIQALANGLTAAENMAPEGVRGQVLTSNGPNSPPSYQDIPDGISGGEGGVTRKATSSSFGMVLVNQTVGNPRVYLVETVDGLLAGKSDVGHDHDERYFTEGEVTGLLAGKSDVGHDHDDRYFTDAEIADLLALKSDVGHDHDDRYYTEAEVDAMLAGLGALGRWEPVTNGDAANPEILFDSDGDVIMEFVNNG